MQAKTCVQTTAGIFVWLLTGRKIQGSIPDDSIGLYPNL
jgi:hypothetical protein